MTHAAGRNIGPASNLIVLHHTDCGIKVCYGHTTELLAKHMGVALTELDALAVTDPRNSVALDIAACFGPIPKSPAAIPSRVSSTTSRPEWSRRSFHPRCYGRMKRRPNRKSDSRRKNVQSRLDERLTASTVCRGIPRLRTRPTDIGY